MMKGLSILIMTLICAMGIFGAGLLYFGIKYDPALIELNVQTAVIEAETEKVKAETAKVAAEADAKERSLDVQTRQVIKQGKAYQWTLAAGYAVKNLWFVWVGLFGVALLAWQRGRWTPRVEFQDGEVKTLVPTSAVVPLVQKSLAIKELATSQQILLLENEQMARRDDIQLKALQTGVNAVKTMRGLMRDQPQPVAIEAEEVDALPAFTGHVHYSQLIQDGDYEAGLIPYGRNIETGSLIQLGFKPVQSVVRLGKQGFGKSESVKPEILTALSLKYEQKQPVRVHLIDAHAGLEGALGTSLAPILPLFDTALVGNRILKSDDILLFLEKQIQDAEARQARGVKESDPWDIIFFDEFTQTVEGHEHGKDIEKKVKELLNLRKARKFVSIAVYDSSKGENSNKGLSVQRMGVSVLVFNTTPEQAAAVIGWEAAKRAPSLREGQCLIKLPKAKDNDGEVSLCQCALVSDADIQRLAAYVTAQPVQAAAAMDAGFNLKTAREAAGFSQNELAKKTGISQAKISRVESGAAKLSEEEITTIQQVIGGQHDEHQAKVVNMNTFRAALENRANNRSA